MPTPRKTLEKRNRYGLPHIVVVLKLTLCAALGTLIPYSATSAAPGDPVGKAFRVNAHTDNSQKHPDVAMDADGDFVVIWSGWGKNGAFGLYGQRYTAGGKRAGKDFQVNTQTDTYSESPKVAKVAMDADGDFVVAWHLSDKDGDGYGVYARRYNADGSSAGDEFQVNTHTSGHQSNPSIAIDADGDFIVAWQSYGQDSDGYGIHAQRYNADGTSAGNEFQVNTQTSNHQVNPIVAMDANGDFVIAWRSEGEHDNGISVNAQQYNADGTSAGDEFEVTTTDSLYSFSLHASIAMDADGNFVIVFTSSPGDVDLEEVYARRYKANGTAEGNKFLVTQTSGTDEFEGKPRVAMDADGDFIVSWQLLERNVRARRYRADGTPESTAFRIGTKGATEYGQDYTIGIDVDADGDFVVVWQSYRGGSHDEPLGNGNDIFARRFSGAGKTVDLNLVIQDDTDPVNLDDNFTYSLITTNNGTGIAMDVNLSAPLPTGVTYVSDDAASAGWACTEDDETLDCNMPYMHPGSTNTVDVMVNAKKVGTTSQTATVCAAQLDANESDNIDTETTQVVDDGNSEGADGAVGSNLNACSSKETGSNGGGSGGSSSMSWLSVLLLLPFAMRRRIR